MLVPAGREGELPPLPQGATVFPYASAEEALTLLASSPLPAVLWSDPLDGEAAAGLATSIATRTAPVVEVRSEGWDGVSHSPLNAACRAVIAGFGPAAIPAAVTALPSS